MRRCDKYLVTMVTAAGLLISVPAMAQPPGQQGRPGGGPPPYGGPTRMAPGMPPPGYNPGYQQPPHSSHSVPSTRFSGPPPAGPSQVYIPEPGRHSPDPRGGNTPGPRFQGPQRDYQRSSERIGQLERDLPVQERLKLPLINKMYRQGNDLMDEGRSSRDQGKMRMGMQQIDAANEKLQRLEHNYRDNHRGGDERRDRRDRDGGGRHSQNSRARR